MVPATIDSGVVLRLADEGVPVAAIARAVRISSYDLHEQLREAISDGRLTEIPTSDWPPGYPRDKRALQISRMVRENREALNLVVKQVFGLRPGESRALVKLVEKEHVSREALHVALSRTTDPVSDIKIVDVAVCNMRKQLEKFGVQIQTLWAFGFKISNEHRAKIMELLLPQSTL